MKDPLKLEKLIVKIGNQEFDQTHPPAYRIIEASDRWNTFIKTNTNEKGNLKVTEKEITVFTVDLAIYLLRRDVSEDLGRWFKGLFLSRKKILKSMSMDQLNDFLDKSMTPILGSKKKGLRAQKKLYDATAELLDKMKVEDLAKLLENLPSLLDGQGKQFSA